MTDGPADWLADAPLFAAWRRFVQSDPTPFTIPGHKRRAGVLDPDLGRLLDADVPLYGGADSVKLTAGVLDEAQRQAAALWGADACRFSTGGSTHANQVLCLAVLRPGDTVLVGRNAHRSVLSGLILAGARPVWLAVDVDQDSGAPLGVSPQTVITALAQHPDAAAVLVTDPSYQGTISDLAGVVRAAHDRDVPVLVDQAWGAHLGFGPGIPPHALSVGADAMITSAHKMLPSFSQAAIVLAQGPRVDVDRLDRAFDATHTTSPTAAILASIDVARALLASRVGGELLSSLVHTVEAARVDLRCLGLTAPGPQDYPPGRFDPAKLVIGFAGSGQSGLAAEAELLTRGVAVEMADRDTIVAQVGLLDDEATLRRLVAGIAASLAETAGPGRPVSPAAIMVPPMALTPREAFFADYERVGREDAVGRISAELIAPYPPGVPLLVPGERVDVATLAALDQIIASGTRVAYAADPTVRTVHVVIDPESTEGSPR